MTAALKAAFTSRGGRLRRLRRRAGGRKALLQRALPSDPVVEVSQPSRLHWLALAALVGAGCVSTLIASEVIDPRTERALGLAVGAVVVSVAVTAGEAYALSGRRLRLVIISPLALAAIFWLAIFVIRPFELYVAPDHAAGTVAMLGFDPRDVAIATAIGGLGASAWCFAYLLALRHAPVPRWPLRSVWSPAPISARRATVLLAFGTVLWGALFLRQGGPAALIDSPVQIREGLKASFYGFVGVWLTEGVAVYALAVYLRNRSATAKKVTLISVPLAVAAAFSLQLRGLAVALFLLAAIVYLRMRAPARRTALLVTAIVAVAVPVLAFAGQVRSYTGTLSTAEAVEASLREPNSRLFISELATFDNLVAIRQLVPDSIGYLEGRTLLEIPAALVPRGLWSGKPDSIDERVTRIFYPDAPSGSPIAMQGELYWNLGLAGVAAGALALGALAGAVARFTLLVAAGGAALVLNAVLIFWMLAFLRDGWAVAFSNMVMAFIGVGLAVFALGSRGDLSPRGLLRRVPRPIVRWSRPAADRGATP